ncbi:hypothetical protein NE236_41925 [Actinoallomurus purpureus]|uniref:hypothetical protein n=1 Tax=Actinoallomurus purpureus TaxID=478114 RepID=UPI0020922C59|nr:hypothetical protein [Actinoallomurus purpureus]MCO6011530.1 hypothetical protein [Actinoallomurus purpureus]
MSDRTIGCLTVGCLGLVIGGIVVEGVASSTYNEHWRTCTVLSKDRGADHDGNSHYRIYTRDCGVLGDEDSLVRGKTNSADIYSQIQPGKTYRLRVVGFRLGLTSDFPNILAVQEVSSR